MQIYINELQELVQSFKCFSTKHIKESERVDALSKIGSTSFDHITKKVLVEILLERRIDNNQVDIITTAPDWTIPFINYLWHGILPNYPTEARRIKIKAPQFTVRDTQLYKRAYLTPWLKCIANTEGKFLLEERYMGKVRTHKRAHAIIGKIICIRVYWPDIYKDATKLIKKCLECQNFNSFQTNLSCHLPASVALGPFICGA